MMIILSSKVNCQTQTIGLKGGINFSGICATDKKFESIVFSNIDYNTWNSQSIKPGIYLGALYQYFLKTGILIETEISYSKNRIKHFLQYDDITPIGNLSLKRTFEMQSISIPIKVGYQISKSFDFIPKIGIGATKYINASESGTLVDTLNNEFILFEDELELWNNNHKEWYPFILSELEISKSLTNQLELSFMILFRYDLISWSTRTQQQNPRIRSLNSAIGIKYRFINN